MNLSDILSSHDDEQLEAANGDVSRGLFGFYSSLVAAGFTDVQAIDLVKTLYRSQLDVALKS